MQSVSTERASSMSESGRLDVLEGMRGYLALWVLVGHVMAHSGYRFGEESVWYLHALTRGTYAVDVFIMLSGFVIFLLLDRRRESYAAFVTRRFFRLYPVYIFLFALAVLMAPFQLAVYQDSAAYLSQADIAKHAARIDSWQEWSRTNIMAHLLMLHGTIPDAVVPHASSAFLVPAWSISLEWQFYLVAPLVFRAVTSGFAGRMAVIVLCIALYAANRSILPHVEFGAFLPQHVEYFFIGAASYLGWRALSRRPLPRDCVLPTVAALAVMLFFTFGKSIATIPLLIWVCALGAVLEPEFSRSGALFRLVFANRLALWAGRVSYSLYLSHVLVMMLVSALLLRAFELPPFGYLCVLMVGTIAGTALVSSILYRVIERPGMELGSRMARDRREVDAPARAARAE
jgi:peptidoglycan/LPS O-acetylase OafA/YrhL